MIAVNPIFGTIRNTTVFSKQQVLEATVQKKLGLVPNAFKGEAGSFKVKHKLWEMTEFSYIENPLPSLFKERLFVYLSTFCKTRYCLVRHVGFLTGLGYPAGDNNCPPQPIDQVIELLQFKLPMGSQLIPYVDFCLQQPTGSVAFTEPNSYSEQAVFACAAHLYLQSDSAADCSKALKQALDITQFEWLIVLINFIHSTHISASVNTELMYEEDVMTMLQSYEQIAYHLLKAPDVYPAAITQQMLSDLALLQTTVDEHKTLLADYDKLVAQYSDLYKQQQQQQLSMLQMKELKKQARLLEVIHDPVIVWSLDGRIVVWNTGAQKHYGYTKKEATGKVIHDLLQTSSAVPTDYIINKVTTEGEWCGELHHTLKCGKPIIVESRQQIFESAGQVFILETNHDITARKQAEEALSSSEAKYRTLFEFMDEGFCIIDVLFDENQKPVDYRFIETNPVFERHTGIVNPKGKRVREIAPKLEQHWFDTYGKIATTGQPIRFHDKAEALNRHYDVFAFKIGNTDEKNVAVLFKDVTEYKALEKQREEFLGIASHELKTPITSIKVYTEILQEMFQDQGDGISAGLMNKLNAQVDRLTDLVRSLLDTTKVAEGHLLLNRENIDLNSLIIEKKEELQRLSKRHRILWQQPDNTIYVNADKDKIGQVLTNLISNAIKYAPEGGDICINYQQESSGVRISVKDSGLGISKEMLPKIFERFYRVSHSRTKTISGLGLGLYITAGIVHQHNGTIDVKSELGKGSVFSFTLPY